jgi:hypothetical protein
VGDGAARLRAEHARERVEHARRAHVVLRSHHVPDFVNGFVRSVRTSSSARPVSTGGGTRRVLLVREGGGGDVRTSETRQWQDEAAHEEVQKLGQRADLPAAARSGARPRV